MITRASISRKGFTLIELSIVLLVLAILVGTLLVGKAIVDRAKITKIIDDVAFYQRAVNMFYDTYGVFPGNMSATSCASFSELSSLCASSYSWIVTSGADTLPSPSSAAAPSAMLWLEAAGLVNNVTNSTQPAQSNYSTIAVAAYGSDSSAYTFESGTAAKSIVDSSGKTLIRAFGTNPFINMPVSAGSYGIRGVTGGATAVASGTEYSVSSVAQVVNNVPFLVLYYNVSSVGTTHGYGAGGTITRGAVTAFVASSISSRIGTGSPYTGNVIGIKPNASSQLTSTTAGSYCNTDVRLRGASAWSTASGISYVTANNKNQQYGCNMLFAVEN